VSMGPPRFYDPLTVGMLYLERAALVAGEAAALRAAQRVREAREDRERIAAFGGTCVIESRPGEGARAILDVPLMPMMPPVTVAQAPETVPPENPSDSR